MPAVIGVYGGGNDLLILMLRRLGSGATSVAETRFEQTLDDCDDSPWLRTLIVIVSMPCCNFGLVALGITFTGSILISTLFGRYCTYELN